jgi:hypothetical protein
MAVLRHADKVAARTALGPVARLLASRRSRLAGADRSDGPGSSVLNLNNPGVVRAATAYWS